MSNDTIIKVNNKAIRARRKALFMTMDEAGQRAGLTNKQGWNKVENGKNPSAVGLYRASRVLGCDMESLILAVNPKRSTKK